MSLSSSSLSSLFISVSSPSALSIFFFFFFLLACFLLEIAPSLNGGLQCQPHDEPLCKLLASRQDDLLITFVLSEEWLGLLGPGDKPDRVRFATNLNAIPSERVLAANFPGFGEAVSTKMEAPFEQLLDRLQPRLTTIVADTHLLWMMGVGKKKNIPVASLWPMSAAAFSVFHTLISLFRTSTFQLICRVCVLLSVNTENEDPS